jgi:ABC-type phosphate transport system substrate-binding protein
MRITIRTVAALLCVAGLFGAEVIITNPGNATDAVSKDDMEAIYQGKKANWPDGAKIVVVVQAGAVHESFLKNFIGKTPSQFATTWKKIVFTGKAKAPQECADDAAMIAYVAATPGAIGYVAEGSAPAGVKVVAVQ